MLRSTTVPVFLGAAATVLALSACTPDPAATPTGQDLTNTKNYSLTQVVQNNSPMDLTVQTVRADNGGSVAAGYPSVIRAGTPGRFAATNVGNGVQLWVTLLGTAGQVVTVDSDVPRVDGNTSSATLSGSQTQLNMGAISITGGDNPTASFAIDYCPPQQTCVTAAPADMPPIALKSGN